jgi:restriction system protein
MRPRSRFTTVRLSALGLDIIYVQAKRWAATVGRPEIQKFAGALHGQHATKGIFITTSDFSRDANDYVSKIVLIDGSRLAELMIEFGAAIAPTPPTWSNGSTMISLSRFDRSGLPDR